MKAKCLVQTGLMVVLVAGGVSFVWADDTEQLKEQVQALQNRVDQLESQLADKQQAAQPAQPVMPVYDQWEDPIAHMMRMQAQVDHNMRQVFNNSAVFNPRMDMKQTDKQYIITMDIPGMDRDKINVENKEGVLTISGERQSESDNDKNNQYYRQERSFGSFLQSIPLPEDAKTDQIDAKYQNGVLTVTIARVKKEEKKPENAKITVN